MSELTSPRTRSGARPCWIALPGSKTLRQCSVVEVSDRSATVASPNHLPDVFDLFLSLEAKEGRSCRAVSRSGDQVAVEFIGNDPSRR